MKIQGKEILIRPHDTGIELQRGDIIVYSIQISEGTMHFTRQNTWTSEPLLMCDTFAACELDEVIRKNKDAD